MQIDRSLYSHILTGMLEVQTGYTLLSPDTENMLALPQQEEKKEPEKDVFVPSGQDELDRLLKAFEKIQSEKKNRAVYPRKTKRHVGNAYPAAGFGQFAVCGAANSFGN